MSHPLHVHPTREALAEAVAERWVTLAEQAIAGQGGFHVALAGGATPQTLYRTLATPHYARRLEWSAIHVFFGDERCVPPDHPDSNFRMAREALLDHVPIPPGQVYRIEAEADDPRAAAADYARRLRRLLPLAGDVPRFDLILLGMGADGHTASLFPYSEALAEQHLPVTAAYVDQVGAWRITLTYPVINQAGRVIIMVAGRDKAQTLRHVLGEPAQDPPFPIQRVMPPGGAEWHVDTAAASALPEEPGS